MKGLPTPARKVRIRSRVEGLNVSLNITDEQVVLALIQKNYFPNHMHDGNEMPPSFTSKDLTWAIFTHLNSAEFDSSGQTDRVDGFEAVNYRLTRFNLLHRNLGIPHPLAYVWLVETLREHWIQIAPRLESDNNQFPIKMHFDGRIASMRYERPIPGQRSANRGDANTLIQNEWTDVHALHAQGQRFKVTTDIANFHPSIYTHSIAWAAVGVATAKAARHDRGAWFNKLDLALRRTKRNETVGLWTGPATTTIAAEMILSQVDRDLKTKHLRYLDDYIFYTSSFDEAERFLRSLSEQLAIYGLQLNPAKTRIDQLPVPTRPAWLRTLYRDRPRGQTDAQDILDYLDEAIELAKGDLQEGAAKFAVNALLEGEQREAIEKGIDRLLNLVSFYPNIAAPMVQLVETYGFPLGHKSAHLNTVIRMHVEGRYSDGLCWMLHLCARTSITLEEATITAILDSGDVCAITLMSVAWHDIQRKAIDRLSATKDSLALDSQWLFWYEMYRLDAVTDNPYRDPRRKGKPSHRELCFDYLKAQNVSFVQIE